MKTDQKVAEFPSNSFGRTFGELRKGATATEASVELAKVVKEVQRTGAPGEVSLKLKIVPSGDGESVRIVDEISCKIPRMPRKPTTFFSNEDGTLQRDNPRQTEMFQVMEGAEQETPEPAQQIAVNQ